MKIGIPCGPRGGFIFATVKATFIDAKAPGYRGEWEKGVEVSVPVSPAVGGLFPVLFCADQEVHIDEDSRRSQVARRFC